MSEERKDLSHYLNNPDDLGNLSDAELDALADNPAQSQASDATANEEKGDTQSTVTPDSAADGQASGKVAQPETQPDGILARDGKHVIPYSRLEDSERRARELAQQVEQLTAAAKNSAGTQEGTQGTIQTDEFLSEEELAELETDLPALAKVIRVQQTQVRNLSEQVATLSKGHEAQLQERENEGQKAWAAALEKNAKAAFLDATLAPEVGMKYVNAAAALYSDWENMSHEARADAIVRQYEAVNGEVKVNGIAQTVTPPAEQKQESKPNVPVSMSGIPGGSAPAVDEAAALLSKTGAELTEDFMRMSPEQIEAQLNRI